MYLFLNGKTVKKEEAAISPFDHGYMYGLGVFETFRTYNGHPFLLKDHIGRLNDGLKEMGISCRVSYKEAQSAIRLLEEANRWPNAYYRLNISAGIGEIGLQTEEYTSPTVLIYSKPLPENSPAGEKELLSLTVKRSTPEGENRLKSHHYFNNVLGKRELTDPIKQEGLFFDGQGMVCEGTVSNVFWAAKGKLFTPSAETGLLNGITRRFIMALAETLNIPVEEGEYKKQELLEAEEIFLCNSIQEIVPVSKYDTNEFPGKNGTLTRLLQKEYAKHTSSAESICDLLEKSTSE